MFRTYAIFLLLVTTALIAWGQKSSAGQKDVPLTDSARLASAAGSCRVPLVKELIARRTDVNAVDVKGNSPLSNASNQRSTLYKLKCPEAVAALTQAGADPWKASFYQNPRLNSETPQMIGVILVEDKRERKGDAAKVIEELTKAVEENLHTRMHGFLHYPILGLVEVRQKLRTAGFSEEETIYPDRIKACKTLPVDAVFETTLKDFSYRNIGVMEASEASIEFALTDCQTGELLWRSDYVIAESRGFIAKAVVSKWDNLCGIVMRFPYYKKSKN